MARPKDADSANTIDRILAAAREVVGEVGADACSFRAVAQRCDVSVGTISYYFQSKAELLEACLDAYYDAVGELVTSLLADIAERVDTIDAEDPSWASFFCEHVLGELVRFHRRRRSDLWLRMRNNQRERELPKVRQMQALGPYLNLLDDTLAPHTPHLTSLQRRLHVQTLTYAVTRFSVIDDEEFRVITGDVDDVDECIVDHLAHTARALLFSPPATVGPQS